MRLRRQNRTRPDIRRPKRGAADLLDGDFAARRHRMPHRFPRKVERTAAVRIARCGCRYKTNNSRERHYLQFRGDTRPLGSRPVGRRTAVARGGEHRPATRHHAIRRQHGDYRRPPETVGQSGQPRPMAQCRNVVRSDRRTRGRQMVGIRNRRLHPVAIAPLPTARAV